MALEPGDARTGTGLAAAISDKLKSYDPRFNPNVNKGWYLPNAVAEAVVEYLKANAEVKRVETSVNSSIALGQAVQVVPATGTGATTAPWSSSGQGVQNNSGVIE